MTVMSKAMLMSSLVAAIKPAAKSMESPGRKKAIKIPVSIKIIAPKARYMRNGVDAPSDCSSQSAIDN